jgi:hypothetical protein
MPVAYVCPRMHSRIVLVLLLLEVEFGCRTLFVRQATSADGRERARMMRRQIVRRSDTSRDVPSRGGNSAPATRVDRCATVAVAGRQAATRWLRGGGMATVFGTTRKRYTVRRTTYGILRSQRPSASLPPTARWSNCRRAAYGRRQWSAGHGRAQDGMVTRPAPS